MGRVLIQHVAWVLSPVLKKLTGVAYNCSPNTWEVGTGKVQGQPWLHCVSEASLCYMTPCVKNPKQNKKNRIYNLSLFVRYREIINRNLYNSKHNIIEDLIWMTFKLMIMFANPTLKKKNPRLYGG